MFFVHNSPHFLHNTHVMIDCLRRYCKVDRTQRYLVIANYIINILVIEMTLIICFLQFFLIPINFFYVIGRIK